MRKIKLQEEDINTSQDTYKSLMVYNFRDTGKVPIDTDNSVPLDDFNQHAIAVGMEGLIWAEGARQGIFVYAKNNIGLNDVLGVSDVDDFILKNPEALWDQYKALVLSPLGYIQEKEDTDEDESDE